MPDDNRERPFSATFDQGLMAETIVAAAQSIESWFDEVDFQKYVDGYRKLALSGTRGALEALARQQVGGTTKSTDPVDAPRFLADTWLSGMSNAWSAARDLNEQYTTDLSRYFGSKPPAPPDPDDAAKAKKKPTKKPTKKDDEASG